MKMKTGGFRKPKMFTPKTPSKASSPKGKLKGPSFNKGAKIPEFPKFPKT